MLNAKTYQTPNAIDPGEAPPSRPWRIEKAQSLQEVRSNAARLLEEVDITTSSPGSRSQKSMRSFVFDSDDRSTISHDQLPSVDEARLYAGRILNTSPKYETARLTAGEPTEKLGFFDEVGYKQTYSRRCRIYAIAFFLVLIVIISIAVGVSKNRGSSSESASASLGAPPATIAGEPSPAATTQPTFRTTDVVASPQPAATVATAATPRPTVAPIIVTPGTTAQPTLNSPLASPVAAGNKPTSADGTRYAAIRNFLITKQISDPDTFSNPSTAQSKAADFLSAKDELALPIPETEAAAQRFVQRYVLTVFYYAMDGPEWKNQMNFLSSVDSCFWFQSITLSPTEVYALGASCSNAQTPEVVDNLLIPQNGLKGILPDELRLLTALDFVDIKRNDIFGKIPDSYAALTNLIFWDMRVNKLTGSLPSYIGTMTGLEVFAMSRNQFTGQIPDTLGELTLLKTLALDGNNLVGEMAMVNGLTNLEYLYMEDNDLSGSMDDTFLSKLGKLIQLDLSGNLLTGYLPSHFFQHTTLLILDLHDNDIEGTFPAIENVNNALSFFSYYDNIMNGTIPETIKNLKNLTHLDLTGNELTGTITPSLGSMKYLTYLFLSDNGFDAGPVPGLLVGLESTLRELSLGSSQRTGTIPQWLGDMQELVLLDLGGNQLAKSIPSELWALTTLRYLLLDDNDLTGEIPSDIQKLSGLTMLLLDKNSFQGDLQDVCTSDAKLKFLSADCNEVTCPVGCCTSCCSDDIAACNDDILYASIDAGWDHNYTRNSFQFSPGILYENTTSISGN